MANKKDRKMNEQELQALLHMRHRDKHTHQKRAKALIIDNSLRKGNKNV